MEFTGWNCTQKRYGFPESWGYPVSSSIYGWILHELNHELNQPAIGWHPHDYGNLQIDLASTSSFLPSPRALSEQHISAAPRHCPRRIWLQRRVLPVKFRQSQRETTSIVQNYQTYIYIYIHTYVYIYIYMCVCMYTHSHTIIHT